MWGFDSANAVKAAAISMPIFALFHGLSEAISSAPEKADISCLGH
jgi:hypothetical protein